MQYSIKDSKQLSTGFLRVLSYKIQHELYAGEMSPEFTRELMDRGDSASVFLYDPKEQIIVLIEQFRIGAMKSDSPWVLETVAGVIEDGLSAEETARKEADEECGAQIGTLEKIASYYPSVGGCNEYKTLFYAEIESETIRGVHGVESENEDIRVVKYELSDFVAALKSDAFNTPCIQIAGYWLMNKLN
ncbi:MAG: ADP-ribose diphosphatase [Cellvibrionaceae bacterium]|nr:ADP-ribose diphosphatase [Cellvibrionaceae bacterium]|tara:strand:+ start:21978 stop:22544 length:567 start_codon:yes stop_codon:yes gene_type:complete